MPPKVKKYVDDKDMSKSTEEAPKKEIVKSITGKIQAFIKKNKLAVASSATAATALAITIGYVLSITSGNAYLMGQSDAIINETKKFIANSGQELIDYFTKMGSTNKASISRFVQTALATMGNIYYRGRGMEGGDLEKKDSKTFADRAKSTIKYVGKSIYDAVVSETGQAIGQGLLFTLILAGVAYGMGPRAAQFARPLLENLQNRIARRSETETEVPMSNTERFYWESVQSIVNSNLDPTKEANVLRNMRKYQFPEYATYHRNHPEMMALMLSGRGLKDTGGGVTDYIKDGAHQAHKFIMSKEGKELGSTALKALLFAAISKGVTDMASSELYDYADKPNQERAARQKYNETKSLRSAARWANEHRREDGYFNDPDIRL